VDVAEAVQLTAAQLAVGGVVGGAGEPRRFAMLLKHVAAGVLVGVFALFSSGGPPEVANKGVKRLAPSQKVVVEEKADARVLQQDDSLASRFAMLAGPKY